MDSRWSATDLAYLAGLLDGEGCFCLHNFGTHRFGCSVMVANTDPRMTEWIQQRFGGSVCTERTGRRWKACYRWKARATDLDAILTAVLPYLVIKRDRAELMLAYRRTLNPAITGPRKADITPHAIKTERLAIHSQLSALNRRGA